MYELTKGAEINGQIVKPVSWKPLNPLTPKNARRTLTKQPGIMLGNNGRNNTKANSSPTSDLKCSKTTTDDNMRA